jgi:hypothetical protein
MSSRFACFLLSGVGLIVLAGCQPPTGTITGKVTYQGKALPAGNIAFVHPERGGVSTQIRDGAFTIDKVPTGETQIAITSPAPPKGAPAAMPGGPKDKGAGGGPPKDALPPGVKYGQREEIQYMKIPDHYADPKTSTLTHTVKSGKQEYNVDLK